MNRHGGVRPGAGRPKGSLNQVTRDVRDLALTFGPAALAELARLSVEAESEAARIAACKEILDRAYGRAPQPVELDNNNDVAEPQIRPTWLDRTKALALFLAQIERERAVDQQGRQLVGTSAEPTPD